MAGRDSEANSERITAMDITSQIRHLLTFLAGLGTIFLSWDIIAPEHVAAVNKAGGELIEPLIVIIGAVGVCISRLAISWLGSVFRRGSGETSDSASGGNVLLVMIAGAMAALCGLPSCSADQLAAARAIPIKGCIVTDKGTACYSSKGGLELSVDATSGK